MEHVHGGAHDSLAPAQRDGATLDEEIAQLRAGRRRSVWRSLWVVAAIGLLALSATRGLEAAEARQRAWQEVNRMHRTSLQSFVDCALPGARPAALGSHEGFHSAMESNLRIGMHAYGSHLDRCVAHLKAFHRGLAAIPVPVHVERQHQALLKSADGLLRDTRKLARGLRSQPEMAYPQRAGLIDRVAGAYHEVRSARAAWNAQMADG